ncbi:hypothetical protein [Acetobacter fabarum]|uniref:hypothetical protein n=1 Tax=Acetobacter fabarum TaxID=483199 RepID=UPI0039E73649
MTDHRFEKPSKGNPYQLTIKQHVFPKRMIKRFSDLTTGRVDVIRKTGLKKLSLKPDAEIFCAMRQWDQRSEAILSHPIEKRFNELTSNIIENPFYIITEQDNKIINSFYALITSRQNCKYKPHKDLEFNSDTENSVEISKEKQELLESNYVYFRNKAGLPSRMFNGMMIQKNVDYFNIKYRNLNWNISYLSHGEIVVPEMIDFFFIPISPNMFLTPTPGGRILSFADCIALNQCINALCQRSTYFFARDLNKCFGFNLSDPWAFHPYHLPVSNPPKL